MKKIFLHLLSLTAALSFALVGCAKPSPALPTSDTVQNNAEFNVSVAKDDIVLKIWVSQKDADVLDDLMVSFMTSHAESSYDISYEVIDESELVEKYSEASDSAADILIFPNSILNDLVRIDALHEVTLDNVIKSENLIVSVESATGRDGKLYAYPFTVDNGYYLFYDKRVIGDEQIRTLDDILYASRTNGKKFYMNISSGFYLSSFFLGADCMLGLTDDGKQVCGFNDETGIKVAEVVRQLASDEAFVNGNEEIFIEGFGDYIAAGITGKWNASVLADKLNDYGAVKLPTFTVDDSQIQMGGFSSCTLVGIHNSTKYPLDAMLFAEWITNEQNQLANFIKSAKIPTNIAASESIEVQSDMNAAALAYQSQFNRSRNNITDNYWLAADELGVNLADRDNQATVADLLNSMVEKSQQ